MVAKALLFLRECLLLSDFWDFNEPFKLSFKAIFFSFDGEPLF